jgi:hypothetical protein
MKKASIQPKISSRALRGAPAIKIDTQECVEGTILIEARPTGRNDVQGTISISVADSAGAATVHFLPRHAREIATTLLAVADKAEQFSARKK